MSEQYDHNRNAGDPEVDRLSMYPSSIPAFSKHFFSPMGENDKLPGSSQEVPRERPDILLYIRSKIKTVSGRAQKRLGE